jgi:superfamily II DNA helicase RecQ
MFQIDSVAGVEYVPPVAEDTRSAAALVKDALQIYVKEGEPQPRSQFQGSWLKRVFERRHDMLVVARTGGGKSLGYMLPPLVEHKGVTVIVQPLKALVAETAQALKENGVDYMVYRVGMEIDEWCKAVVCTTDMAASRAFLIQLEGKVVNWVVIDEAHCYEDEKITDRMRLG